MLEKNKFQNFFTTKLPLAFAAILMISGISFATSTVVESYKAPAILEPGTVVSLVSDQERTVEIATQDNQGQLFGVATKPTDSGLRLSRADDNVFVTTLGPVLTFVSDVNGEIKNGDRIGISPINGVAMRVNSNRPSIGIALQDFTEQSQSIGTKEVPREENGEPITAHLGLIQIQVQPGEGVSGIPSFLANVSESLAGKPVPAARIYAALAVIILMVGVSTMLILSAVKTSISSIGRNPLSKKSIYKSLLQVAGISILLLLGGLGAAYVVLKV